MEDFHIVWVCVTPCLISAHIQIINMLMTLSPVSDFSFTLEWMCMSDMFICCSHQNPRPLCPGHCCCEASVSQLSSAGRSPGVRLKRGTQGARVVLGPLRDPPAVPVAASAHAAAAV